MMKKIVLALLLIGFIGILILGGINRTQAKTAELGGDNADSQNAGHQPHGEEDCDEEGHHGNINSSNDATSQEQRSGTGFQSDSGKENNPASLGDSTGNRSGSGTNNQSQTRGNGNRGNNRGNGQSGTSDSLTATEIEALQTALDDD